MKIDRLDHLVLTVRNVEITCEFYSRALQMEPVLFAEGRWALSFGSQKINLHPADTPFVPHALNPTPGSADFCLITLTPIREVVSHLEGVGVTITEGPVKRTGAAGQMTSVYFRDPDSNLVEVSVYDQQDTVRGASLV